MPMATQPSIVCWNYLYLSQKIAREEDPERRQELLAAVKSGSVVSWRHVNLHGEYDFSEEKMQDSVGLEIPPSLALNLS
jgi:Tn3 transposase DDE domain